MDLISMALAAVGGALGAGLGLLVTKLLGLDKSRTGMATGIGAAVCVIVAHFVVAPQVRTWQTMRELDANPLFAIAKRKEPALFAGLEAEIRTQSRALRPNLTKVRAASAQMAGQLVAKYTPMGSNDALIAYFAAQLRELEFLRGKSAAMCKDFLQPVKQYDYSKEMPKALIDADTASLARLIESSGPQHLAGFQPDQALRLIQEEILPPLANTFGEKLAILDKLQDPASDAGTVCDVSIAMYQEMLKQPPPAAGQMLRWLMVQGTKAS